jgi:hypothetical protein
MELGTSFELDGPLLDYGSSIAFMVLLTGNSKTMVRVA